MKLLVIFNPHAATGKAMKILPGLRTYLADHSIEADLLFTSGPGDATELVAKSVLGDYDGVIAAGGDGSVF